MFVETGSVQASSRYMIFHLGVRVEFGSETRSVYLMLFLRLLHCLFCVKCTEKKRNSERKETIAKEREREKERNGERQRRMKELVKQREKERKRVKESDS